ncbi:MAG: DUF5686 family protein [candidate division Zixibacteria bacterium]|nr:DUF5686 family protein [candidate division Zixibacteria bacterium]
MLNISNWSRAIFSIPLNLLLIFILFGGEIFGAIITGTVSDSQSGQPIPYATVRVEGTGRSMLANASGQYRLRLENGTYRLKFSHIAYYSDTLTIESADSSIQQNIKLRPGIQLIKGMKVYERQYDEAQRIILEAIARKDSILAKMKSISFEAYTRMVLRDRKETDSVKSIGIITETQSTTYYQWPDDKRKEVIIARRQSANLLPEMNEMALGWFIDLNRNRVGSLSVISPTAKDALDYYNYYILDTLNIDGHQVFRLEMEPKSQGTPLFVGTVDIVDSVFAVVGADIGFNKAVQIPNMIKRPHYSLRYACFEKDRWMPVEIHFSFDLAILLLLPPCSVDIIAALHNYNFDVKFPDSTFDYAMEIAENVDKIDSTTWDSGQLIPLTENEARGYKRIDSVVKKMSFEKIIYTICTKLPMAIFNIKYDIFHFNRVEGAYIGISNDWDNIASRLGIHVKTGWAFSGKYWQHNYGMDYTLSKRQRLKVGLEYYDEITRRPTIISSPGGNPTFVAIVGKADPYDYYLEKGFSAHLETKVITRQATFSVSYKDFNQSSVPNKTDYSLFHSDSHHRPNPAIVNGKYRTVGFAFQWATTELIKNKGKEKKVATLPYTGLRINLEMASPKFIKNDFDFSRYSVWFYHQRRLLGLGLTSAFIYVGASEKNLPPQRYFTLDCAVGIFYDALAFKTMGEQNYAGNRAMAVYFKHDFGTLLFLKSGLPLIKKIPFSLSVYGGAFWTDFRNHSIQPGDELMAVARKPYREIGFSIGNLPMLLRLNFTWQLSHYSTSHFAFNLGMGF